MATAVQVRALTGKFMFNRFATRQRAFVFIILLSALIQLTVERTAHAAAPSSVIVNPTSGLITTEDGGTDTFTVRLSSPPGQFGEGEVFIFTDFTEGSPNVTTMSFNDFDWNIPKTVIVTGQDDDIDDGDINYLITVENLERTPLATISATNIDNDTSGFEVSPVSGLSTTEAGGTDTFTVKLSSQPTGDVTTVISSNDTSEGTVSPSSLTFTGSDWKTPQMVTITGVNDDVDDDNQLYNIVLAPAMSSDPNYNGINPSDVSVSNTDNDTAGFNISQTSGIATSEAGGSDTFTVRLTSKPTANVTIPVSSSDTGEGTVSPSSLSFTTSNWNTPKSVTVTGVNDNVDDDNQAYSVILAAASSSDSKYSGLNPSDVAAVNSDNDTAGFTVTPVNGLTTTEAGGTDTFTIKLNSQPTANVSIGLSSSDLSEGTVSPASVTFTASNWSTPKTVTIFGVDDKIDDGTIAYTIVTAGGQLVVTQNTTVPILAMSTRRTVMTTQRVLPYYRLVGLTTSESGSADTLHHRFGQRANRRCHHAKSSATTAQKVQ